MEALEHVVYYVEASTLVMGFSTKVFEEYTSKMVGSLAEDDMEGSKAK